MTSAGLWFDIFVEAGSKGLAWCRKGVLGDGEDINPSTGQILLTFQYVNLEDQNAEHFRRSVDEPRKSYKACHSWSEIHIRTFQELLAIGEA